MNIRGEQQKRRGQVRASESLKTLKNCFLKERAGVFFLQMGLKGSDNEFPQIISSFSLAHENALCSFRLVTSGTAVVGLFVSVFQSGTHSTVLRGMFGDSVAVAKLQGGCEILASIPVNSGDGGGGQLTWVQCVILSPMVKGVVILKNGTNEVRVNTTSLLSLCQMDRSSLAMWIMGGIMEWPESRR
jgi:hypothetical protein